MSLVWRVMPFVIAFIAVAPSILFAQNRGLPDKIVPCNGVDCTCEHLIQLAQNLINTGIFIAVFLCAMLFAYAGWQYMTQETIGGHNHAKDMFVNVAIGLIIILAAWLVVDTLMRSLLANERGIVWNNICAALDKAR